MHRSINTFRTLFTVGMTFVFACMSFTGQAQDQKPKGQSIDKIVAVVGGNIALQSELESQYLQMLQSGIEPDDLTRCRLYEELLYQKLLLNQAQVDSVVVTDSQVEDELGRRIDYFVQQIGSVEKLEEYYEKSILEIKDEFRRLIRDQMLSQQMQQTLAGEIKVTPSEVRAFFRKIPTDSLPYVNSEIELGRVMKKPDISEAQLDEARMKANELRDRVLNGESFKTMAILYSEDDGSAKKGGELGFFTRGQMVPEFEAMAFRLKKDSISPIFKTDFGYHFMQNIERRGEQVNVRHILIKAKPSFDDVVAANEFLDSLKTAIENDSISFEDAASRYSDDEDSRANKGMLYNVQTGSTKFEMSQLSMIDQRLFLKVEKMAVGAITDVMEVPEADGATSYNIFLLKSRTEPHVANLKDDYQRIQEAARSEKQSKIIGEWIAEKTAETYVRIDETYQSCPFNHKWVQTVTP